MNTSQSADYYIPTHNIGRLKHAMRPPRGESSHVVSRHAFSFADTLVRSQASSQLRCLTESILISKTHLRFSILETLTSARDAVAPRCAKALRTPAYVQYSAMLTHSRRVVSIWWRMSAFRRRHVYCTGATCTPKAVRYTIEVRYPWASPMRLLCCAYIQAVLRGFVIFIWNVVFRTPVFFVVPRIATDGKPGTPMYDVISSTHDIWYRSPTIQLQGMLTGEIRHGGNISAMVSKT